MCTKKRTADGSRTRIDSVAEEGADEDRAGASGGGGTVSDEGIGKSAGAGATNMDDGDGCGGTSFGLFS